MTAYNIYLATETEKYNFMDIVKKAGAVVQAVSGCGTGYYIQIAATEKQAEKINNELKQINGGYKNVKS